jgi:predicted regulator of amino acid metabolism with ACT domain
MRNDQIKISDFDQSEDFFREVQPLMQNLWDVCQKLGLPIMVICCYAKRDKNAKVTSAFSSRDGWTPTQIYEAQSLIKGNRKPDIVVINMTDMTPPSKN